MPFHQARAVDSRPIERGRTARFALWILLVQCVAPAAGFADSNYRVVAGDDCSTIAEHLLGARRYVGALHRSNPQLGAEPHQLRVEDVLRVPEVPLVVGKLRDVVGEVTVQTPLDTTPRPGADAVVIAAGTVVTTGNQGTVVFQYGTSRGATFRIGANARVRINAAAVGVNIEHGRLTASAARGATFVVTSKWARVTGSGRVVVGNEGTAISNHGTSAIAVELMYEPFRQPTPLVVQPGFGVYAGTVVGGARPQVERLPAPTKWGYDDRVVLADDNGASVEFTWGRNAAEYGGYRLQLTAPETGAETMLATRSDQAWASVTLQPGRYLSAVSTFSPKHLESLPTPGISTTVARIDAPWMPRDVSLPPQLPLGARIKLPTPTCEVLIKTQASSNPDEPVFADFNWAPTVGSGGGRSWLVSEAGEHLVRCGDQTMRFTVPAVTVTPMKIESPTTEQCIRIDIVGSLVGDALLVGNDTVEVLNQSYCDGDTGFQTDTTDCINFRPVHAKTQQRSISAKIRMRDSTASAQLAVMVEGSIVLATVAIVPVPRVDPFALPTYGSTSFGLTIPMNSCEFRSTPCRPFQLVTPPLPRFEFALGATAMTNGAAGAALRFGYRIPGRLPWRMRDRLWLEADAQLLRKHATTATVDATRTVAHLNINADVWRPTSTLTLRALIGFGASAGPHAGGDIEGVAGASLRWQIGSHAGLRVDTRAVLRDATQNSPMAEFGAALYTTFGD
jgi:hypothetical protein